jgi:four helix bundle protein
MMQITELEVWKAGIELAKSTYDLSEKFPSSETYGLGYQLRRTVSNIPANISAAASRKYGKESLRHLFRARDMIYEIESHFYLANKLEYISEEELNEILETLNTSKRLLFGFIKYYKRSTSFGGGNRRRSNYDQDKRGRDGRQEIMDVEDEDVDDFDTGHLDDEPDGDDDF